VTEKNDDLKEMIKTFLGVSLPLALIIAFFTNLLVGLIIGLLLGLFCAVHLSRRLQEESFEINMQNKDKMKGFSFYEKEIISIMDSLRYQLITNEPDMKIWEPSTRAKAMGGNFKMEVSPYSITIHGTRGMVRIVVSMLDIEKIFI
jgi:hypothetical protein